MDVDRFTATPGELLASVADLAPGPFLMSALLMVDRSSLGPDEALLFVQLHERVTAWWHSLQTEALVSIADPEPRIDEYRVLDPRPDHDEERVIRIADAVREEVAAALRLSPMTAQRRIDHARLLAGPLSGTCEALAHGEISAAHAAVIVEAGQRLSSGTATADWRRLEERVLPVARRSTVARCRAEANRAVEAIDAAGQWRRREAARRGRDVYLAGEVDGMTDLVARLETQTARALMAAIEAAVPDASMAGECGASIGERRAEVLAALVLGSPAVASVVVNLDVTVSAAALGDPAVTDPVLAQVRGLLDDPAVTCSLRPVVLSAEGHVLDVGRRRYEVPAALRRLIVARDRTCRFPGCGRAAERCQIDHAEAWEDGGRTDIANLGALCTRHHQLKTHGGWRIVESSPDGSCTWVSPRGLRYRRPPEIVRAPGPGVDGRPTAEAVTVRPSPDPPPF